MYKLKYKNFKKYIEVIEAMLTYFTKSTSDTNLDKLGFIKIKKSFQFQMMQQNRNKTHIIGENNSK